MKLRCTTRNTGVAGSIWWLLTFVLMVGLNACRSQAVPAPLAVFKSEPVSALQAAFTEPQLKYIDQHKVHLSCMLVLHNNGDLPVNITTIITNLSVEGVEIETRQLAATGWLQPGDSQNLAWQIELTPSFYPLLAPLLAEASEATWLLTGTAIAESGTLQRQIAASSACEGQFMLIREPELTIHSLRLLQHDLVNVRLALVVEIYNPNRFDLVFAATKYEFFGEGKLWNRHARQTDMLLPANSRSHLQLPILLNFTDMDRRMLDLVAGKKVIRYRLKGSADILTKLDFLTDFVLPFDRAGSVQVE